MPRLNPKQMVGNQASRHGDGLATSPAKNKLQTNQLPGTNKRKLVDELDPNDMLYYKRELADTADPKELYT
jgi:hypothetical protein